MKAKGKGGKAACAGEKGKAKGFVPFAKKGAKKK